MTQNDLLEEKPKLELPPELLWLLDAPMFIDEKQVDAFYDAVVRPDYEGSALTLSKSVSESATFGGDLTLGVALPWFGKAEAGVKAEGTGERERGLQRTLTPVSNSYRHLLTLALHYATADNLNDRLLLFDGESQRARTALRSELPDSPWDEKASYLTASPRALAFLDLPDDTRFIPAALELTDGSTVMLFDDLGKALCDADERPPPYPGSRSDRAERDKYWRWFSDKFNNPKISAGRKALQIVESSVNSQNRIQWIAYRVPLGRVADEASDTLVPCEPFLHLHVAGRGLYDTGTFGYNLISRGIKHGMRIVGTLKSEPDMNVLAIFER